MKIPGKTLFFAATVLAGAASSVFGQNYSYFNDFTETGFPSTAHSNEAGSFTLNTTDGLFNYTRTELNSHTVSTASEEVAGVAGEDFIVSTWLVLNELSENTSGNVYSTYGIGILSDLADFTGAYYLVDFRVGNNTATGDTRQSGSLRIRRQGETSQTPWGDSPVGGLETDTLYELRVAGTYDESGTLTLLAGLYDESGAVVGEERTMVEESPLAGDYFGYRSRIVNNTQGTVDMDNYGYSIGDEPFPPPPPPAPLLIEITNLDPAPDSVFNPPEGGLQFTVSTEEPNTIDPADIELVLNGTPVEWNELDITGASPSFDVSYDGLEADISYTAEVTASDDQRTTSRTWTFYTKDPDSPILEDVPLRQDPEDDLQGIRGERDLSGSLPEGATIDRLTDATSPTAPMASVIPSADEPVEITWDLGFAGSHRALARIDVWLAGSDPWRTGFDGEFAVSNDGETFTPIPDSRVTTALTYTGSTMVIDEEEVVGTGTGNFNRIRYEFDAADFPDGFRYLRLISHGFDNLDEGLLRQPRFVEIDASVTLGPPHIAGIAPAEGAVFHEATEGFRFGVTTGDGGELVPDDVDLFLNGEAVASGELSITGTSPDFEVFYDGLESNRFYTVTAVARDGGFETTHAWNFDTLVEAEVFVIEAEDYNFAPDEEEVCPAEDPTVGGGYFNDPVPSAWDSSSESYYPPGRENAYADRVGAPDIDFHSDATWDEAFALYRLCDVVGTGIAGDVQRSKHEDASIAADFEVPDYQLQRVQTGEWFNYTRSYPEDDYRVLLRAEATGEPVVRLDRVTSDPSVPGQTTESLGEFIPSGTGGYEYLTLTDEVGQPVILSLSGEDTLRLSAVSANNNVNLNYLVLVPAAELPPVLASTSPEQGTGHHSPGVTVEASLEASTHPLDLGSIRLFVNDVEVSADVTGDGAAATVSATPGGLPGLENIARVEFDDTEESGPYSAEWRFSVLPEVFEFHALQFDGVDDFMDITEAAGTFGDFTVSGWFNILDQPENQFLYRITNREGNTRRIQVTEADGELTATLRVTAGGTQYHVTSSDFEYGEWVHIAFVREGDQLRLYLDGEEAGSTTAVDAPVTVAAKSYLGANPHPWDDEGSFFFRGSIDEFQIWNVARTRQEIADSMFEPLHEVIGPDHDLHARFGLNEGAGDEAYDYSGPGFVAFANATWIPSEIFDSEGLSFTAWIDQYELPEGQDGPGDNPSGDGIANLIKYALGGDPTVAERGVLPLAEPLEDGGEEYLSLSVDRDPGATEASLVVEVSGDLVNWFSGSEHTTVLVDTASELVVRDNVPVSAGERRFIRLRVAEN